MIAAIKRVVVAIGLVWIRRFRRIEAVDIDASAVTVVWGSVLVAFIINCGVVTSF